MRLLDHVRSVLLGHGVLDLDTDHSLRQLIGRQRLPLADNLRGLLLQLLCLRHGERCLVNLQLDELFLNQEEGLRLHTFFLHESSAERDPGS